MQNQKVYIVATPWQYRVKRVQEAKIYQRIWKTGQNTDVITIRKDLMDMLSLKRGDTVEATIKKVKSADAEEKEEKTEEKSKFKLFTRRE